MSQLRPWILQPVNVFGEIVQDLKAQGVTILYSSHYIEEVEHTADRILVLNKGELIRDTTPLAMRSEEIEKHFILPLATRKSLRSQSWLKVGTKTRCSASSYT